MNCKVCKGACCEVFELLPREVCMPTSDARHWLELHAIGQNPWTFECKCRSLSDRGRCMIYDDRPLLCQEFPVGGKDCLLWVKRRRSRLDYSLIRDDSDPVEL